MSISSISSNYSTYSTSSTSSSISSVSSLLSTYHDEVVTGDSSTYGYSQDSVSISSAGMASMQTPPDFDNMSIDDFREHLSEMQSALTEMGYSSDLDISSLTDDELSSIKDDMASRGPKGGNPPPPPPPSSETSSTSVTTDDLLDMFLSSLEDSEESSYQTIEEMLALYSQIK